MASAVAFLLELVPALLLGVLLARRWPELAARLAPPLVRWGVPFSLMGLLLRSGLQWQKRQRALWRLSRVVDLHVVVEENGQA